MHTTPYYNNHAADGDDDNDGANILTTAMIMLTKHMSSCDEVEVPSSCLTMRSLNSRQ